MLNIKILLEKANYLHSNYIGNEGSLDYPNKQYGYLCDDIEDVEVGFYKDESLDSDYAERLRVKNYSINELEAIGILAHRINEIEDYYIEIGSPLVYNMIIESDALTVESAKQFLEDNGYYTQNLWQVSDVQADFNCTEEEAQNVLNDVLNSDRIKGEINETIDIVASAWEIPKKQPKNFAISGYWKDNKVSFVDQIVSEGEEEEEEESIFFYELSEENIKKHIELGEKTWLEFVITSYEPTTLN